MTHVIALATSKGGTGKTTTALNLSVTLADRGRRTVLVDLDPQGAIGLALARSDTEWSGLAEHLLGAESLDEVLVATKIPTLKILPRGRLDPVDVCRYEQYLHTTDAVATVIQELCEDRDYVIVDNPSGLGMITRAALAVSDFVLAPLQAEPMALRSFTQLLRVIDHVRQEENPRLQLLGVLPTMVRLDQEPSLNVMSTVWSEIDGVLETVIPRADVFAEASELGLPVAFLSGKTPPEARRFDLLASELEAAISELSDAQGGFDEKPQRELL